MRWWAFWRRAQYLGGVFILFAFLFTGVYYAYLKVEPTCFDNSQNGEERGIDCGGACSRVCALDVLPPGVQWTDAFRVTEGQYNAVAYIENKNLDVGSPRIGYTFSLYDEEGLITERTGTTVLPPDSVYPIFEGRINTGSRIPTQTFIELDMESVWLPADAGREQFVIEGRKLKGADSAPLLTAQVRNTALTDAQDLEIVATIFDTRGNALTSSRTIVPLMEGRATKDIVFTWPEPIANTLRSCEVPTDIVLGIDLSGSMNDDGSDPPEPITSVLAAASSFVERLGSEDQVSVVTYATEAELVQELTGNVAGVGDAIIALSIAPASEVGSTNTGDAIAISGDELLSSRHNQDARKVLVLLTDGLANAPGVSPEEYALQKADTLKGSQTEIFTIGLGDNVNESFLQQVATSEEYYYRAVTTETLDQIYQIITDAICEDGPAVIDIVPKTATSFAPLQ